MTASADTAAVDLRLLPAALAVWCAAAVAQGLAARHVLVGAALLVLPGLLLCRCRWWSRGLVVLLVAAALAVSALRLAGVQAGPVRTLAAQRAVVNATGEVVSDPRLRPGRFGDFVLVRLTLTTITGRGVTTRVRSPVLLIGDPGWRSVGHGTHVRVSGRLDVADGADLAGVLVARGPPRVAAAPGRIATAVNQLRAGLRHSVAGLPPAERSLVPALVTGDDSTMPEDVADDFRETGLTHLLAVSGANLTLVLAFVLTSGRWCGVRSRGLLALGAAGVVGFVLLARTEPSVLRAAAMGVVALAGLGWGGARRGVRALCAAVVVLVLIDPWLARSVGFALSVLATGGILLLAPRWRDAMSSWAPRPAAEALAVPLAAQLVCTPLVAAISGQVSLVAVLANVLAAPAVAPATILGVVATVTAPVSGTLAGAVGWLAGRAAWWIVAVARHGADLPGAAVSWTAAALPLAVLALLCVVALAVMPRLLRHRAWCLLVTAVLVLAIWRPVAQLGWPPSGWVMVACDVGQGDAVVLNAGAGAAVVVDAGPDPAAVDGCLDRLGVTRVPLVVLSHLHSDHAAGVRGVTDGRPVAELEIGPLNSPADQFRAVVDWASAHGAPVRRAVVGEARSWGALSWQVLGPSPTGTSSGDTSAAENNASLVLLVRTRGVRLLLTGDIEPEAQQALLADHPRLRTDVLKVPHHGSRYQHPELAHLVGASVAVVSAGADNEYGHPAPETLATLSRAGAETYRTDLDGDVAICVVDGQVAVHTQR